MHSKRRGVLPFCVTAFAGGCVGIPLPEVYLSCKIERDRGRSVEEEKQNRGKAWQKRSSAEEISKKIAK